MFKDIQFFLLINLIYFLYDADHDLKTENLEKWIKQTIKKLGKKQIVNSIFVLAYPRILGFVFNPLSIFTCLDKDGRIIAQIYEVHNTFKQRHFYITENTFTLKNHEKDIKKAFFVSPFMGMKGKYRFKSFINKKNLSIFIEFWSRKENNCLFYI